MCLMPTYMLCGADISHLA